jgi:hypothetical protein
VLTLTPADQVPLVGLTGVAAGVHEAADATDQTVTVVAPARPASPEARLNVVVSVGTWLLVVVVVLVIVMLPVEVRDVLPVAGMSSLPSVVLAQPEVEVDRVAAPAPRVALAPALQYA